MLVNKGQERKGWKHGVAGATAVLALFPFASPPAAAATRAGQPIVNVAGADFAQNGASGSVSSNSATTIVQEELGVTLSWLVPGPVHVGAGQDAAIPFVLTNAGNGSEAFILSGSIDGLAADIIGFAIDRDGDGRYDPSVDTAIAAGSAIPALDPGAGVRLLVLVRSTVSGGTGTLSVATRAVTGSGTPGTVFAGLGDGGVDAIVGPTSAAATLAMPIVGAADAVLGTLEKSQTVLAPDGTDNPVSGATITYSIKAQFDGTGSVAGARIDDPIPEGTDYVPGSLRMDAAALTDASGDDAGDFSGSAIQVSLGTVMAPATRTISFQVKIR